MESLSVVKDFDVVEDGFSGGFTGGVVFMVHAFGFQGVKKLSETALSQQLPLRLMLCSMPCCLSSFRWLSEAY
jgi:hypothetical protein